MNHLPEHQESLWRLVASPIIWAAHFLLSYVTVAIWCAKVGGMLGSTRVAIGIYTIAALAGIAFAGWRGLARHRLGSATVPHDFDTPEDRHRFLGFATLLLSALSAVATIYVALTIFFIDTCH